MYPLKQNTANWVPVGIRNSSGVGITGLLFNAVGLSFAVAKNGAAKAPKTLASGAEWIEDGGGWYRVLMSVGECDTPGLLDLLVTYDSATGAYPFTVVANLEADTKAVVDTILTRTDVATSTRLIAGTVAADVTAIKAKTDPLVPANLDVAVSTRLATAGYTAPPSIAGLASQASVDSLASSVGGKASQASVDGVLTGLVRLMALVGDNVVIDSIVDPGTGATSIRERGYDSKANADAAYASSPSGGTTGLLYTFTRVAVYAGDDMTKSKRTTV